MSIKKLLHVELKNNIGCRTIIKNTRPVNTTVDLDAFFGLMKLNQLPSSLKVSLNLNLNKQPGYDKIKSGLKFKSVSSSKPISSFPHFKIGTAHSNLGCIDNYAVACLKCELDIEEFQASVYTALETLLENRSISLKSRRFVEVQSGSKITGNLLTADFAVISEELCCLEESYKLRLYFESFGNKNKTLCGFVEAPKSMTEHLENVFYSDFIRKLIVDICVSCSVGTDSVTFACKDLFDKLHVEPNYCPLLCQTLLNANYKNREKKKGAKNKRSQLVFF